MASHDLISLQVALEPLQPEEQGTAHPLLSCLGTWETESPRSAVTSPAHNPTQQRGVPGKTQRKAHLCPLVHSGTQAQPGGWGGPWGSG